MVMEGKQGLETITELKKLDVRVKIMAMSGGGNDRDISYLELARSLGASAVIERPFNMKNLPRTIERLLAQS